MAQAKTELEVLQEISTKMDSNQELQTKEMQKLRDEAKAATEKYQEEVKQLQKELAEKGATLLDITNEVKELKAKGGRIRTGEQQVKSLSGLIAETIEENKAKFLAIEQSGPLNPIKIDTKTVGSIASTNLTGANYINYLPWQPGMEPTGQTRFRDIFPTFQSDGDFINYPRAKSPIGEGSFGRQATEGTAKAQVDRDYEMVSLTLKAMAGFAIVSRQSLRNIPFLQSWLPTSMMESLMDAEDTDFANTLVAAATGVSTTSGVTVAIERLIHFIKNLRKAKHSANAVMIDPDIWATILTFRPGTDNPYSVPGVVTVDANGNVKILGRPVYDVNWLTGGRVLVSDTRKAGIVQSEGLTMRQSDSHASIFTSNETAFLIERTEGLAVFRPEAHITAVLS